MVSGRYFKTAWPIKNLNWLRIYVTWSLQVGKTLNTPHTQTSYFKTVILLVLLSGRFLWSYCCSSITHYQYMAGCFFQSFSFTWTMSQQMGKYLLKSTRLLFLLWLNPINIVQSSNRNTSKAGNMFKVNNKHWRMTSMTSLWCICR